MTTVKRLFTEYPVLLHFQDSAQWPLLHRCIADPVNSPCLDLDVVKSYVSNGGDLNQRAPGGLSLLFLARANFKGTEIANYLVSCGASMSSYEEAVISIFEERGAPKTLEALLKQANCIVYQTDHEGLTLLHHAVARHRPEAVKLLILKGAAVNILTNSGRSPLGMCGTLSKEHRSIRELLASKGATLTTREAFADALLAGNDDSAIKMLITEPYLENAWYRPFGPFLHIAAWYAKTAKVVEHLLNRGVDANSQNEQGETALHRVMLRDSTDEADIVIVNSLLDRGADINKQDERGYAPLHRAAAHDQEKLLRLLVERGADINVQTIDHETPLDFVLEQKFDGYNKLASFLKSRGAVRGTHGDLKA